jgi:hypothetical protein
MSERKVWRTDLSRRQRVKHECVVGVRAVRQRQLDRARLGLVALLDKRQRLCSPKGFAL